MTSNTIFISSNNTVTRNSSSFINLPTFRVTFTKSGTTYTSNYTLKAIYEKAKHVEASNGRFIYGCVKLGSAIDTTRWILTSCDNGAKAIFMKVGLDLSSSPAKLKVDALVSNTNVSTTSSENKFYLVEDVCFPDAT